MCIRDRCLGRIARITRIYEGTNEVCRLQSLMYINKLSWFNKLWVTAIYRKLLKRAKKGPEHVSVRLFKLADWIIKNYVK